MRRPGRSRRSSWISLLTREGLCDYTSAIFLNFCSHVSSSEISLCSATSISGFTSACQDKASVWQEGQSEMTELRPPVDNAVFKRTCTKCRALSSHFPCIVAATVERVYKQYYWLLPPLHSGLSQETKWCWDSAAFLAFFSFQQCQDKQLEIAHKSYDGLLLRWSALHQNVPASTAAASQWYHDRGAQIKTNKMWAFVRFCLTSTGF